ncbi:MAG: MBL fold metallo-hydrolase [Coriobacteriia bacterium]|nr:MBL fold metallo-hydrolase [Coriobacteriia bacterium]
MRFTVIGHCTVLIEADGIRILTDPFFELSGRVGFVVDRPRSMTAERAAEVADVVLISHGHYDHFDQPFISMLRDDVPVVVPLGFRWPDRIPENERVIRIHEGHTQTFGPVRVTAVPALHLGVAAGYVIESGGSSIYFAGDTRYGPFMADIGVRFSPDVALLPQRNMRLVGNIPTACACPAARDLGAHLIAFIHRDVRSVFGVLNLPRSLDACLREIGRQVPGVQAIAPENGIAIEVHTRLHAMGRKHGSCPG